MRVMRITEQVIAVRLCSLALALACAAGSVQAGTLRTGLGVDYTSGTYGGTDTVSQIYVPASVGYRSERWGMRLTVPWVSVDGPGTIIDGSGGFIVGQDEQRSGLGDVTLAATLYDVVRIDTARFHLDLGAKVKFGTASTARGLGTGENDFTIQTDLLKTFDRMALFASVGYRLRGDPPGTDLRNTGFGIVGGDIRIAGRTRIGLMYDHRPSAIAGEDALREATVYASLPTRHGGSVQPYLVAGLGDGSPGWGGGLFMAWPLRAR